MVSSGYRKDKITVLLYNSVTFTSSLEIIDVGATDWLAKRGSIQKQ